MSEPNQNVLSPVIKDLVLGVVAGWEMRGLVWMASVSVRERRPEEFGRQGERRGRAKGIRIAVGKMEE